MVLRNELIGHASRTLGALMHINIDDGDWVQFKLNSSLGDLNFRNELGETHIMRAVGAGRMDMYMQLLHAGASPFDTLHGYNVYEMFPHCLGQLLWAEKFCGFRG